MKKFFNMRNATNETIVATDHIRHIHYEPSDGTVVVVHDSGSVKCNNATPEEWAEIKRFFGIQVK